MKRDVFRTADQARVSSDYDMTHSQIIQLARTAAGGTGQDLYTALDVAFRFGYVMGGRADKAGKYEEARA